MRNENYLKLIFVFLFVCGVAFFYWCINGKPLIGIDDANIAFIYMRNLAHGHGFVYNAGGEHVEGVTCLLWTLFGSLFFIVTSAPEKVFLLFLFFLSLFLYGD